MKTVDASGARSIEATSPAEKAIVFRDSFVNMSKLPDNFPDRPVDELNQISVSLNDILSFHRCEGSQFFFDLTSPVRLLLMTIYMTMLLLYVASLMTLSVGRRVTIT